MEQRTGSNVDDFVGGGFDGTEAACGGGETGQTSRGARQTSRGLERARRAVHLQRREERPSLNTGHRILVILAFCAKHCTGGCTSRVPLCVFH